ncbi:MAG: DASS family sodium-coupled anion symporter [Acidobacteria bacterium]|nr:DASS family sodium-coupled anion symporter [Acidobacteriota bacterium]
MTPKQRAWRLAVVVAVYCAVVYGLAKPENIKPESWRLLGVFLATVTGLILEPLPGAVVVLIGVTMSTLLAGLTPVNALSGYADPAVWLVTCAFMISRALINTGLARRIALVFVRMFGKSPLGISYSLAFSDVALATVIPSNGARSGGVVLPILEQICELYGSRPGPTAAMLGTFLIASVYQSICISTAMFLTGQASNPIAAGFATQAGVPITWASWFVAGSVPGLAAILLAPLLVSKILRPGLTRTPEAAEMARSELSKMGSLSQAECILAVVFIGVCFGWMTNGWLHKVEITVTALIGCTVLLLTGVLKWEDVKSEKALWDLFIWYGGMVKLGKSLNESGVTQSFAKWVGDIFHDSGWVLIFVVALLIYFYAHYMFASITAHVLAMYPPFLAVLAVKGAPIGLVAYSFAIFVNFSAGLTTYGTTPSPMYYGKGFVSMQEWYKVGVLVSLLNLAVWSTVGFAWWKILGIW